jgi:hypothetical protein
MVKKVRSVMMDDNMWEEIRNRAKGSDLTMGDFLRISAKEKLNRDGGFI